MKVYFENKNSNKITEFDDVCRIDKCKTFFGITGYEIRYTDGTFSIVDEENNTLVSVEI